MIASKQQEFSNAQAPTTSTTTNATNVIDLGTPGTVLGAPAALTRDVGPGTPIDINIAVTTAFAGEGTLTVKVVTDTTASLATATTVAQTAALTTATLKAGAQMSIQVLPNLINKRYLGLQYTCTTFSAGALSAAIVAGIQTNKVPAGRA